MLWRQSSLCFLSLSVCFCFFLTSIQHNGVEVFYLSHLKLLLMQYSISEFLTQYTSIQVECDLILSSCFSWMLTSYCELLQSLTMESVRFTVLPQIFHFVRRFPYFNFLYHFQSLCCYQYTNTNASSLSFGTTCLQCINTFHVICYMIAWIFTERLQL